MSVAIFSSTYHVAGYHFLHLPFYACLHVSEFDVSVVGICLFGVSWCFFVVWIDTFPKTKGTRPFLHLENSSMYHNAKKKVLVVSLS